MALAQHVQQHEIRTRLHYLGITEEQLREVVSRGFDARKRTTAFHPPSAPGFYQWSEIVVGLQADFRPAQMEANDAGGFSTVVSPDGAVAIAVAAGSEHRSGTRSCPTQ